MPITLNTSLGGSELAVASQTINAAGTTTSSAITGCSALSVVIFQVDITAISGAGATLTVSLQDSLDGTNWFDVASSATAALNATGHTVVRLPIPFTGTDQLRFKFVAGGTPSVTFSVSWFTKVSGPVAPGGK